MNTQLERRLLGEYISSITNRVPLSGSSSASVYGARFARLIAGEARGRTATASVKNVLDSVANLGDVVERGSSAVSVLIREWSGRRFVAVVTVVCSTEDGSATVATSTRVATFQGILRRRHPVQAVAEQLLQNLTVTSDGLNDRVLRIIIDMAAAARDADVATYNDSFLTMDGEVPVAVVYLTFLLGQTIMERFGERPTDDAVIGLVKEASICLRLMGRFTDQLAADLLRSVLSLPTKGEPPVGNQFVLYAGVLLGVLVRDFDHRVSRLRPKLV